MNLETAVDGLFAKVGKIGANGRMVHEIYLAEAKKPSESKGGWDIVTIKQTIPGDQAYQPLSESTCPLIKR